MQDATDPARKAASTYNAAADHFDDKPLAFWSRSGYRWIVEQMGPEDTERARRMNADWLRAHGISAVETNVLFTVANKPERGADGDGP